jgi:FHS family L-fucose permease-like MFS transporter
LEENQYKKPFYVITILFFLWGHLTAMNDILIPYLKNSFSLTFFQALLVQTAFFGAYFIGSFIYYLISIRLGDPINKIGYKNGIITGLLISAMGLLMFFPAASFHVYAFFLGGLFTLGLGFTLLQIAANPYVAILGPEKTSSSRLNLAQGFNSFGTFVAPLLGAYLIFELFSNQLQNNSEAVKIPYLIFASIFILIAFILYLIKLPEFKSAKSNSTAVNVLKFKKVRLGVLAIFAYVGAEVAIGSLLISFAELPEIAGLSHSDAALYVSLYWGGLMIGRFTGSISLSDAPPTHRKLGMILTPAFIMLVMALVFYLKGENLRPMLFYPLFVALSVIAFFIGKNMPAKTLGIFALVICSLITGAILLTGYPALWLIVATGLFNSIMWSNIFAISIDGMKEETSRVSSLLVMAILGGALIPPLQGLIADFAGIKVSFILPMLCYLYLSIYGFMNSKIKNGSRIRH